MKTAQHYLDEAHAVVERITAEEAIARHGTPGVVFVDVRDSAAISASGTIAGAVRVPRGFIEFAADDSSQHHNPVLKKDTPLCLICGAGGQAALAGRTLTEMGFRNVTNIGGFSAWKDAGGPTEDA